jgi:hypothetical protein
MPRSRSNKKQTKAMPIELNISGSIQNRQQQRKQNTTTDLFAQLDFTEEGNRLFNEFMDAQDQEFYELEATMMAMDMEIEKNNAYPLVLQEVYCEQGETNYSVEEFNEFWTEHNWFHECDICWENTRNGDCKCLPIVEKMNMSYPYTHTRYDPVLQREKSIVLHKKVKDVPVLSYF